MFLATTSLDKYWDKNQKILFLGEWCLSGKAVLKEIDYEVLPYHWHELKDAKESLQYLDDVFYEVILRRWKHKLKIYSSHHELCEHFVIKQISFYTESLLTLSSFKQQQQQ